MIQKSRGNQRISISNAAVPTRGEYGVWPFHGVLATAPTVYMGASTNWYPAIEWELVDGNFFIYFGQPFAQLSDAQAWLDNYETWVYPTRPSGAVGEWYNSQGRSAMSDKWSSADFLAWYLSS